MNLPASPLSPPDCIAIAGPTASGKTQAALALAQELLHRGRRCEIISVDSALVYRGMDVGTAKPTPEERALVPHHLMDIRDPQDAYSVAEFVRDTSALLTTIRTRAALPLLVGGTMLYLRALMNGMDELPAADAALRARLDEEARCHGWPALHARLAQVDPVTAARLPPGDSQRIQRALEVWHLTGRPLSQLQQRSSCPQSPQATPEEPFVWLRGVDVQRPPSCLLLSLEPVERAWLHARIAARFDAMLEAGLVQEVQRLRQHGSLHPQLPSMRSVGYRQAWQALDEVDRAGGGVLGTTQLAALREAGTAATRQLAKRQLTWLRGMKERIPIACDGPDAVARLVRQALMALGCTEDHTLG